MSPKSSPDQAMVTLVFCGQEPRLFRFGWVVPGDTREFDQAIAEMLIASSDWQLPKVKEDRRDS